MYFPNYSKLSPVTLQRISDNIASATSYESLEDFRSSISDHAAESDTSNVFVCTYAKYNQGLSLSGMWVNIDSFDSYEEFSDFCSALHADEGECPEIMLLDCENLHRSLFAESIGESDFNDIKRYCEIVAEHDYETANAFLDIFDTDKLYFFDDMFWGEAESERDFAEEFLEGIGGTAELGRSTLERFFDYDAYARELFDYDFTYSDGYVFRNEV
jgi:antirestriction protein